MITRNIPGKIPKKFCICAKYSAKAAVLVCHERSVRIHTHDSHT